MSLFLGLKNQAKWVTPFHLASFKEGYFTSAIKELSRNEGTNTIFLAEKSPHISNLRSFCATLRRRELLCIPHMVQ